MLVKERLFTKRAEDDNYYAVCRYRNWKLLYLNRPLKLIELTMAKKDVLALDFKIEANTAIKRVLNMSRTEATVAAIEKLKNRTSHITIKSYDPKIWKDYNAIEPLQR
jgi:hypothetical protein